ncbi:hypothetical protein E2562_006278 [Oryza meyeriana var. granulata]|uniref:Peptidase C14 caspase domain-containing protein n=1 Tax=Oryza meyeriana var. granulata TaxID=110450 RepID=A0A6G1EFB4_9ORYZ|nr:hypothetical protein E2562_006278 [Oryza meyeriana var. granulata]
MLSGITSQYKKARALSSSRLRTHQSSTNPPEATTASLSDRQLAAHQPSRCPGRAHPPRRSSQPPQRPIDRFPVDDAMGRKRAVLVAINYPGTEGELKGCLNDVARMRRCLVDRFGFDEADIRVLTDADPSTPQPTGANIRLELERLVGDVLPGDTLFFHYSGHGLQLPIETGCDDDDTGYDECIVPCDMNLIKDQDFTELVQKVPDGCLFTMVSDSCHSGGLIDKTKEQTGNSTKQSKAQQRDRESRPASGTCSCASLLQIALRHLPRRGGQRIGGRSRDEGEDPPREQPEPPAAARGSIKNRSLPLSTFVQMLRDRTEKDDVGVGSIRTTLFHHFGDDASPKIRRFAKAMLGHSHHGGGTAGEEHPDNAKPERIDDEGEADALGAVATKQEAPEARAPPRNGVLISGCQTDETSADATTPEGVSYGALSNAIQTVLAKERGKVTNMELVRRVRELLVKQGYTQQPGLYCSDKHANVAFICSNH